MSIQNPSPDDYSISYERGRNNKPWVVFRIFVGNSKYFYIGDFATELEAIEFVNSRVEKREKRY